MRDDLLHYYERELSFLRRNGAEFAKRYPKIASRLLLEPTKCDDPHVERMLEGFALMAARVQLKIDDDFPEVTEALLDIIYPQFTRPIPSMALVEFHLDAEQANLHSGVRIPRETILLSRPVGGVPCQFRTCFDTTLWPLKVTAARWMAPHELKPAVRTSEATSALRVELECFPGATFADLDLRSLRIHLAAEPNLASTLYELLCNNCTEVLVRDCSSGSKREPISLPASSIEPGGFGEDQSMLPINRRTFPGYRLLQEYFTFPEKFMFLDISGLERACGAGFGRRVELIFMITPFQRPERRQMLESGVNPEIISLGGVPIVNLFPKTAEPILLHQKQPEYLVIPDASRREQVATFSVDEVVAVTPGEAETIKLEPLYSFRHGNDASRARMFWRVSRRPARWRLDEGTDFYLSFADSSARTVHPDADVVTARLTCHNGDLPSRLPFGDPRGDFELLTNPVVNRITTLLKPTPVIHPHLGKSQLWRLTSQLSLNYLSLMSGGAEMLQELLRLNNFGDSAAGERQIQGILDLRGSPYHSRITSPQGLAFARGQRVEVEFDEENFAGGGVYVMASVLERFLALNTSLNSFSSLVAHTRQRKKQLKAWPPRAGHKALL
jgi:type VI secretion system protein ImpG